MNNKLYCFYTLSHEVLFHEYLRPSASIEYDVFPLFFKEQLSPSGSYSKEGWRETQYNKVLYWIESVSNNLGRTIVCCDVDVQFLGKSFDTLSSFLGSNDIIFQSNERSGNICSGFFVCKCNEKTLNFLNRTAEILKTKMSEPGGGEQYVMRDILYKTNIDLDWDVLPRSLVWSPGQKYKSLNDLNIPKDIICHHANWVNGVEAKIDQLNFVKEFTQNDEILPNPASRIALCSSSLLRNMELTYRSLIDEVILTLPEPPDFFGYFTDRCDTNKNIEYLNKIKEYCNNFIVDFKPDIVDESLFSLDEKMNKFQRHGHKGNILQWQSMQNVKNLKKSYENKNDHEYECTIWTRPDLYFFNSLDNILNLEGYDIYNVAHDNHLSGICDRFSLGSSEAMDKRMDILDYFKEWYFNMDDEKLFYSKQHGQFMWNPEIVYKDYLNYLKLTHGKLNLCFGKARDDREIKVPFWHDISGNENSGMSCGEDIVNSKVLRIIESMGDLIMDKYGNWMTLKLK